jgi:hypothetical protein
MGIFGFLLKFARMVVDSVMKMVTAQINIVETIVMAGIKQMVQQVLGGIWKGQGADAFVAEMDGPNVMGELNQVTGHVSSISTRITKAIGIVERADQTVRGIVGQVADIFNFF